MLKPTVGPIVGHTTTDHARIFLRGAPANNRVFAGIRHRRQGDRCWSEAQFVELKAYRDMTGVIVLRGLRPDTRYEYQAGWFSPLRPTHTVATVRQLPLPWPRDIYQLRTPSDLDDAVCSYIVGSCRYLQIAGDKPLLPGRGDRIFASIHRLVKQADPPIRAVLMTGDQVYLDDLNKVAPDRNAQDILLKYRTAFSQPRIQQLMSCVPTYMILDDHEIEDNWPAHKDPTDDRLYANALDAYGIYQASHGPAGDHLNDACPDRLSQRFWYRFAHGDIQWFVTDSRTRRNLSQDDRRILDEEQERALLEWLLDSPARVKFVVTGVMFYPDAKIDDGDAWQAFPQQRLRLLEAIRVHRIKNVIFVSGDVHGSLTSRLAHSRDPDFEVHTIVSSPLCNSLLLPYATASTFTFGRPMAKGSDGEYRYELTSRVISQDNFARLQVTAQSVQVTFHDRDGASLEAVDIPLR